MNSFTSEIFIYGINPYMVVPDDIVEDLLRQAGKMAGPVPVRGKLDGHEFIQTLVKYRGQWMVHLNEPMRRAAGKDVGDTATMEVEYDPRPRTLPMHPALAKELKALGAEEAFYKQPPSRQQEILRYLSNLKSDAALQRNAHTVARRLAGEKVGGLWGAIMRDKPIDKT